MNKTELIETLAAKAGLTKALAREALDTLVVCAAQSLNQEGRFTLAGLGVLEVVSRPARTVRNPRTGEMMVAPASKSVKFKSAKNLKEAVNPR